jgi:hypothetical protein
MAATVANVRRGAEMKVITRDVNFRIDALELVIHFVPVFFLSLWLLCNNGIHSYT